MIVPQKYLKVIIDKVLRSEPECVQENKYGQILIGELVFLSHAYGLSLGPD
jgi:hypothetical protein